MQPVASFEAIHLNGINSQAAIHGAVTETMIGTNAPTRIKTRLAMPLTNVMHTEQHELTCELRGRSKVGYNLYGQRLRNNYAGMTRCSFNNAELTWPPF